MAWTQDKRPFRLTTPLGADVLLLVDWEGEEHVSALYRYTVTCFSSRSDIQAKDLLLQRVSLDLELPDGTDRKIAGVVSRLSRGGSAPAGYFGYQLEIVPPHWMLGLDSGFDIFQKQSARDVITQVLKGTDFIWKQTGTLRERPYCFRYRESRWSFVSRLLEQEGIWFRIENTGGTAKLILADSTASAQPAWGLTTMRYNPGKIEEPRLTALRVDMRPFQAQTKVRTATEFLPGKNVGDLTDAIGKFKPPADIKVHDFDPQLSGHHSGFSHTGAATSGDVAYFSEDVKRYSRTRQEEAESGSVRYAGESRYVALEAGAKVEVADHPSLDSTLFVTTVRHTGSNGSFDAGDKVTSSYRNSFEAVPFATPYRPARVTPWPHVGGSHVAVVVGPIGEEIYTDPHGRVQVVFAWDVDGKTSLDVSCWVRVAQSFAGKHFGSVFLPRVGHEVLVEFLDGNPDNPVIVGSLYNAANMPPWKLPDNKTQSGVKTRSSLKGTSDNYNELRFEDKKGDEQINVQAEKNLDTLVKNDETRIVGHNRKTTIHKQDEKIVEEGDDLVTVNKGDQVIQVLEKNRTLFVKTNHNVTVEGQETIAVTLDRKVTVDGHQKSNVKLDRTLGVQGKQTRVIKGNDETEVKEGNSVLLVKQGDIGVKASLGNIVVRAQAGTITIKAEQGIKLQVGESSIVITQEGIKIKGAKVEVEGTATAMVKAPMTQVKGDTMVVIQGGMVNIN